MDRKSLYDISLKITEKEYREDPALSYSVLAKFDREGFNGLKTLFSPISSPSLTFGAAVDALITRGQEEFDSKFIVADTPVVTTCIENIVKTLFNRYPDIYKLSDIPEDDILKVCYEFNYQPNWRPATRLYSIVEKGESYFDLLQKSEMRTIISKKEYEDICNSVNSLKSSPSTSYYFEENNPFDDSVQRFYQLKFKSTLQGIDFKCMPDLLIVDHVNKTIQPIDLKTSSHYEWDFYKSFVQWKYDIQARLYWRIIRFCLDKDPYFKDFLLFSYKFIVVNRNSCTPLVWVYYECDKYGDLYYGINNKVLFKEPFAIASELQYYLKHIDEVKVPRYIDNNYPNSLSNWLDKI